MSETMYLIKNVKLYTGESIYPDGAVLTDGPSILYAGDVAKLTAPPLKGRKIEVIDGRGGICMPGLCSAHSHVAMTILRGVGGGLPLSEWLQRIFAIEALLTDDDICTGATLAIMEYLRCGVTCFADMYIRADGVLRAACEAKIRANACVGATSVSDVAENEALFHEFDGEGGLLRVYLGIHSEYATDKSVATLAAETALKLGTGMHVHVSETSEEVDACRRRHGGKSPVTYLCDLGIFDIPTIAAHCVHVDEGDMETLASHNVTVAHCPASNMKLSSGAALVAEMQERGVKVAIGTDGPASNNTLDMFREMRLAALLSSLSTKNPASLSAADAITMATVVGAQGAGFSDVGILRAGYTADLIIINGEAPFMATERDVVEDIVYVAAGGDVQMTMVGGQILYLNGKYTTIDTERAIYEARAVMSRLS
ncbi:MAG: amidohydrolase [Eubacteriales bacterium]|jgi:5-methylthioadenosine/S-adenosylhomocysteine deaminase|nr:amidohydrolase [Clostridiales bacterium]